MNQDRLLPRATVAFIGHFDAGKSTLIGRLLHDHGCIDKREFEILHLRATHEFEKQGKGSAFVVDKADNERRFGRTLHLSDYKLETDRIIYTLLNVPGHKDLMKNTIAGISLAYVGVFVIGATEKEFEHYSAPKHQIWENLIIAFALGLKRIIICVNKMDQVEWSQKRFDEIKEKNSKLLGTIGFKVEDIYFIPLSAWTGENLLEKKQDLSWYSGPHFMNVLESTSYPQPLGNASKPLRFAYMRRQKIPGIGRVVIGKVISGTITNQTSLYIPGKEISPPISSIELWHNSVSVGICGDIVSACIKKIDHDDFKTLGRAMIFGDSNHEPLPEVSSFLAQIVLVNHPTKIKVGYTPLVHCHVACVSCKFVEFIAKVDKNTGKEIEKEPKFLQNGDSALVKLCPIKSLCLEPFAECAPLGRFVVRDMGKVVAVGIVKSIEKKVRIKADKEEPYW